MSCFVLLTSRISKTLGYKGNLEQSHRDIKVSSIHLFIDPTSWKAFCLPWIFEYLFST